MSCRRWVLALLLAGGGAGAQSPIVRLEDPGHGPGPALLKTALANPYDVIAPGPREVLLPRDSVYRRTVIVLGTAALDGTVEGDLIVIGGDLHLHPRATVRGRAVAIGGGVYQSALITHVGSSVAFRDFTYDIEAVSGGFALRYRSLVDRPQSAITWPGLYGVRVPMYDRANGVSLGAGPLIAVPNTGLLIEPRVTYRSQLGVVDPGLAASFALDSRSTLRVSAESGTFTNEAWIWPDLMNSLATLFIGHDTRNYYRAKRAQASGSKVWQWSGVELEPYLGARWERDRSVRPDSFVAGGPWSFHGRQSFDDMLRPNPPINPGDITSGIGGFLLTATGNPITGRAQLDVEAGNYSAASIALPTDGTSRGFAQATFDGTITFPTFGVQTLRFDAHAVVSFTDDTPRQRWAYVGGSGSVPTLGLAERGGNQLLYIDARYNIPIERITLPIVGAPVLTIREVLAGADDGRFPALAQATGLRLTATLFYVEFLVDPARRTSHLGIGVTQAR